MELATRRATTADRVKTIYCRDDETNEIMPRHETQPFVTHSSVGTVMDRPAAFIAVCLFALGAYTSIHDYDQSVLLSGPGNGSPMATNVVLVVVLILGLLSSDCRLRQSVNRNRIRNSRTELFQARIVTTDKQ